VPETAVRSFDFRWPTLAARSIAAKSCSVELRWNSFLQGQKQVAYVGVGAEGRAVNGDEEGAGTRSQTNSLHLVARCLTPLFYEQEKKRYENVLEVEPQSLKHLNRCDNGGARLGLLATEKR